MPSTVACGIILTPWVTMYDYQNLLLIPYPPMDFTYAQVNGQSTRVYQDGIMVEGVTESGSKNEEVVSAE